MQLADRVAELLAVNDIAAAKAVVASIELTKPAIADVARSAIESHATDPARARLQLAALHLMDGDHDRAIAEARAAIAIDDRPQHRSSLGSILLAAGRPEEAAQIFRTVIADTPDDRDAHINLATAAFNLGDYGTAMSGYARAFDLDPSNLEPIHNLMRMFAEMGKWLGAIAALDLSRKGEPPVEVAVALDLVSIELVQLVAKNYPPRNVDADADRTVRDLIANVVQRGPKSQLVVARALIDIERFAEATKLVDAIARSSSLTASERGDLHYVEGVISHHAGDAPRALERYLQALSEDPRRIDAATNASSLLLEVGTPDALAKIGAMLERVDPVARANAASLLFNESLYLFRTGRAGDARTLIERVLTITRGEGQLAVLARSALAELGA